MRKAIIAVALLGLLAGSVQAKSYNMVGWWREYRTGSETKLYAAAAVNGDITKSNLLLIAHLADVNEEPSGSDWAYKTSYEVLPGFSQVSILKDGAWITFVPDGSATNLSKQKDDPAYHPSEFRFTMSIIEQEPLSGDTALTGTVIATWSNDEDPLQTYDSALVYGVGPEIVSVLLQDPGDYGLNVVVDISGIPEAGAKCEPGHY